MGRNDSWILGGFEIVTLGILIISIGPLIHRLFWVLGFIIIGFGIIVMSIAIYWIFDEYKTKKQKRRNLFY
jgi:hypothetical protein